MQPNLFDGYKTYIAAGGLLLLALLQWSQGNSQGALQLASAALAAVGLRHAIDKIPPPPPATPNQPVSPA